VRRRAGRKGSSSWKPRRLMPSQIPLLQKSVEPLETLRRRALSCHKCPLHVHRTKVVFGIGNTGGMTSIDPEPLTEAQRTDLMVMADEKFSHPSERAPVAIVGEAPGEQEDQQGEPFVGRSGMLLNKMIEAMGYERAQFYLCNVTCCRPVDEERNNRAPEPKEIEACRPFLEGQLHNVRPKVILAVGATAARALIGTSAPVGQLRGRWWQWHDIPVRVTYHPAALLRNEELKAKAWKDLQEVMRLLRNSRKY